MFYRSVAQLGRALRSGRRGRVFESRHSDFAEGGDVERLQKCNLSFFMYLKDIG